MKNKYLLLFLIVILAFILRFYRLGEVPLGFHQDEISQAYNSFSILKTGHDRYGKFLPILFRSFGSYQPPVYTYLTTIPILLFGTTVFAARSTSAFFGALTVVVVYFLINTFVKNKYKDKLALLSSFILAISPWSIHFSRRVVEGNLGLFIFLLSLLLFILSLKKIKYFIIACILLGISTHAYYSERLIAIIFLPFFLYYFKKNLFKHKKIIFIGLISFGIVLLPHIVTVVTGAFFARFDQVGSSDKSYLLEFIKHFISYFSPKYLFSDAGNGLARVSPGLGVFYSWFFIPFCFGLYNLKKYIEVKYLKFLLIFSIVSLIPVSLTGDVFYPLRALEFFFLLGFIISIGIFEVGKIINNNLVKSIVFLILTFFSFFNFYVSYFVLFQHETTESAGNTYFELSNKLKKYQNYKIILDSTRDPAAGLRIAYFVGYDSKKFWNLLSNQMKSPYYSKFVNNDETYLVDNIEARSIDWKRDRCSKNTILIGDSLAISKDQIKEHNLVKAFEINGINDEGVLFGYKTNPDKQCKI